MDLINRMLLYILVAVSIYSFHTIKTQEEQGMDIESIQLFLGHSSLESTQLYTHITQDNEL